MTSVWNTVALQIVAHVDFDFQMGGGPILIIFGSIEEGNPLWPFPL